MRFKTGDIVYCVGESTIGSEKNTLGDNIERGRITMGKAYTVRYVDIVNEYIEIMNDKGCPWWVNPDGFSFEPKSNLPDWF